MKKTFLITVFLGICIFSKAQNANSTINSSTDTTIYIVADQDPNFPGGISKFYDYIYKNIRYPSSAILNNEQGTEIIQMIVEKDGSLSNFKILRSAGIDLDNETIRIAKHSKKWDPAILNGKQVRFQYTFPLTFKVNSNIHYK